MYKKTKTTPKYEKKESYAKLPDQRTLKKEETHRYEQATERIKEQRELERLKNSTRYDKGILTNHTSYQQPKPKSLGDLYMLNPMTMYYHSDPNLAFKNYVRMPANVTLGYKPASTSYGGKKAA